MRAVMGDKERAVVPVVAVRMERLLLFRVEAVEAAAVGMVVEVATVEMGGVAETEARAEQSALSTRRKVFSKFRPFRRR